MKTFLLIALIAAVIIGAVVLLHRISRADAASAKRKTDAGKSDGSEGFLISMAIGDGATPGKSSAAHSASDNGGDGGGSADGGGGGGD
jgi:hypothetical protein